jgi:hypothetical protein
MKLAAHHRALGDEISLEVVDRKLVAHHVWGKPDVTYASAIFEKSKPLCETLLHLNPRAIIGGSGWNETAKLADVGVTTLEQDYTIYPTFTASIGFSQRGCRLACKFCKVPRMEGKFQKVQGATSVWRGEPHPRHLVLLDNDFFGDPNWRAEVDALVAGGFKVNFNQGINARFLNDETAAAISRIDYRDVNMKDRRLYTAWDNARDEARLFRGLELLLKYGVRPRHIVVYILLGFYPWSGLADWEYRRKRLREMGIFPYPMPFNRTPEAVGFQRWVIGHYDKRGVTWDEWVKAAYQPRRLFRPDLMKREA